jgi:excisionase family DNA binding protein
MATKNSAVREIQPAEPTAGSVRAFKIEEFCRRYPIGRTKAYEEISSGRLRAHKVGRRTIITAEDAEDWLRHLPLMKATNGHGEVVS